MSDDQTFERKVLTPAQREARKVFAAAEAKKAISDHEKAQKAFHKNRERLKAERLAREAQALQGTTLPLDGNIFNSQGVKVAIVRSSSIFSLRGEKLYDLRGTKIYKPSGELVGHLPNVKNASERRLDRATDKLFPTP